MRILITGATGLIGKPVLERLANADQETVAFVRRPFNAGSNVTVELGDIRDAGAINKVIEKYRPDVVIHMAALLQFACEDDPRLAADVNVIGTLNILEACRAYDVSRLVFGSSIAAYGMRTDLMHEDDPLSVNMSVYGETKRLGEVVGARYAALGGSEFVALRYSGIFGPGAVASRGMAMARHLIKTTATEGDVVIPDVIGEETTHMTYLDDAVEATALIALSPTPLPHTIYNIAGPDENFLTLQQFHDAVRRVVPTAGKARFAGPRARSAGPVNTSRIRADTGFEPRFTVEAGFQAEFSR
ncbi:MAG: NAD(P)-dependent oxidoreductase [Aquisalimonadaceae bacterium]